MAAGRPKLFAVALITAALLLLVLTVQPSEISRSAAPPPPVDSGNNIDSSGPARPSPPSDATPPPTVPPKPITNDESPSQQQAEQTPAPRTEPPIAPQPPAPTTAATVGNLLLSDVLKNGDLSTSSSKTTPVDVVVPFDGELTPKQLGHLLEAVKGTEDALGTVPQWDDQLRLTLRSLQKHLLCVTKDESKLTIPSVYIVVPAKSALPSWLRAEEAPKHAPSSCGDGSLSSTTVQIITAEDIGAASNAFNQFVVDGQLGSIRGLSPHFLYVPAGTVFTRAVSRDDFFEPVAASDDSSVLFPRKVAATDGVTDLAKEKLIRSALPRLNQKLAESNNRVAEQLFSATPGGGALFSVHVVNTYLFTRYASGKQSAEGSEKLGSLSSSAKKVASEERSNEVPMASRSVSPLVLHAAALLAARPSAAEADAPKQQLRHHTVHMWTDFDTYNTLKPLYSRMKESDAPLTVRVMPVLRHPMWMEQFLWGREQKALAQGTSDTAQVMGLSGMQNAFENAALVDQTPPPTAFPESELFPNAQDPVSKYPCGPLRKRLSTGGSMPSPGVVNDLLYPEPASSPRSLPPWDAVPHQNETTAAAATVASMMCWYPGRPLHAEPDEIPEVNRVPTLSERVGKEYRDRLDGHEQETSQQNTVKNHRLATIDIVYTYVRGDAPKWLKELRKVEESLGVKKDDGRIRDWDELRYSLRSIKRFVCRNGDCCGQESGLGIGAIYIVLATEEHIPDWMANYTVGTDGMDEERAAMSEEDKRNCRPPLRIIPHRLIYPGAGNNPLMGEHKRNDKLQAEFLPTFNSHGIESCLHRIPGLRKHYVYLNNDYLFGRNVTVVDFFRPVVHEGRIALEPLLAIEALTSNLVDAFFVDILENGLEPNELELEQVLWKSDPVRYSNCENWAIRRGVKGSVQVQAQAGINLWTATKAYNYVHLFDRMETMEINRRHSHVAQIFDRDTMYKMQEVDFADVSYGTRKYKVRHTHNLATEVMYLFYASAHRRERGTLKDGAFCVPETDHNYPHGQIRSLYHQWNHKEAYVIDRQWGYHWFYQVHDENIKEWIEDVRTGKRPKTTFVSVNDNFGRETNEAQFDDMLKLFRELLDLLVSSAPRSWYE